MPNNQNLTTMPSTPTPGQGANLFNEHGNEVSALLSGLGDAITAVYDTDGDVALVDEDNPGGDNNIRHIGGILLPAGASGAFDVNFPSGTSRMAIVVDNDSGQTATLQVSGQSTPPTLADGFSAIVSLDGTVTRVLEFGVTGIGSLKATASEIRSGTADRIVTADNIESASEFVTLTDATTIAVDWETFINGTVTLTDNRTLGNPTNGEPGTWRTLIVNQDGTGSRTLAFGGQYTAPGGLPTISTGANARDVLFIQCVTSSDFIIHAGLGVTT